METVPIFSRQAPPLDGCSARAPTLTMALTAARQSVALHLEWLIRREGESMNTLRRKFIGMMTLAGAGSLASGAARLETHRGSSITLKYAVQGFTCITCAVGLETLLRRQKGVLAAKADYHAATATIIFDPHVTEEASLRQFISTTGFRIAAVLD